MSSYPQYHVDVMSETPLTDMLDRISFFMKLESPTPRLINDFHTPERILLYVVFVAKPYCLDLRDGTISIIEYFNTKFVDEFLDKLTDSDLAELEALHADETHK